jgi:pimeloyl-ACP methyl ester carboxylesterase
MKASESLFYDVRGLRYHIRRWPGDPSRRMVLLHGWMDVSASFQFLVDALAQDWDVYAPDWRGYGLTDWGKSDCYWFPDYVADLDLLLERIQPEMPVNLVGHSLGGNVAALYAGVRPARIRRLVNLEGFGMAPTKPQQAPQRYGLWLDELHQGAVSGPIPISARSPTGCRRTTRASHASARSSLRAIGAARCRTAACCCAGILLTRS